MFFLTRLFLTSSLYKVRTKSQSTWLHKHQIDKCYKSIKITISSKQNRKKLQNTERRITIFAKY